MKVMVVLLVYLQMTKEEMVSKTNWLQFIHLFDSIVYYFRILLHSTITFSKFMEFVKATGLCNHKPCIRVMVRLH